MRRCTKFGAAVREVLDERGLSLRAQREHTGIDHDTASAMRQGVVPRADKVIAFARGLGLDVNGWLVLAGYDPIEPVWDPDRAFMEGIRRIREETGSEFLISTHDMALARATPEEVEAMLALVRARVLECQAEEAVRGT